MGFITDSILLITSHCFLANKESQGLAQLKEESSNSCFGKRKHCAQLNLFIRPK